MNYLRLITSFTLCLFITATSVASADPDKSVTILVAKADETTAKVTIGTQDYLAPITFENSLSWNDVKDGYSITPEFATLFQQGRVSIYIECTGAQFRMIAAPVKAKK